MSSPTQSAPAGSVEKKSGPATPTLSPAGALASAFFDTIQLLFNPFKARRWIKLSLVCLFLGGGTTSAAFHWSLSTLASDTGFQAGLADLRDYIGHRAWLVGLSIAIGVGLAVTLVYLRAFCRFLLVDSILNREILIRRAWPQVRPLAQNYFLWLLGLLPVVGAALAAGALVAFPYLRTAAVAGTHSLAFSMALAILLLAEVTVGLLVGLVITLTDDLVVPVIYAERVPLLAAWKKLGKTMWTEVGAFTLYVVLRFIVSVAVGIMVLAILFPALVALFSFALIAGALLVLSLRLVGIAWVWTPFTVVLAAVALLLLMGLLLVLMSLAGMPGQILLQNFGMRFITHRVPALNALWRVTPLSSRRE